MKLNLTEHTKKENILFIRKEKKKYKSDGQTIKTQNFTK